MYLVFQSEKRKLKREKREILSFNRQEMITNQEAWNMTDEKDAYYSLRQ
jgi:hypothetical protein